MTDLETAARAAYGAFALSAADRLGEMPPWESITPDARADWRAVADAVLMLIDLTTGGDHPDYQQEWRP